MKQPPEEDCSEEVEKPEEVNGASSESEFVWLIFPVSKLMDADFSVKIVFFSLLVDLMVSVNLKLVWY